MADVVIQPLTPDALVPAGGLPVTSGNGLPWLTVAAVARGSALVSGGEQLPPTYQTKPYIDVRDYAYLVQGGDWTTALQAAVDAAALVMGIVLVPPGTYICNNLILKSGVTLRSFSGQYGYGPGAIRASTLQGTGAGWVVDTPNAGATTCALIGINLAGSGAAGHQGGVRFQHVDWGKIQNVQVDNCANEGMLLDAACMACVVEDVLTTNVVLDTTRGAAIGAVDIAGTDHYLSRVEANPSLAALSNVALYIAAIMVRGTNNFLTSCVGEFGDIGIRLTDGGLNRLTGCRGDTNWGHGVYLDCGLNVLTSCEAVGNSRAGTNTYSGFYFAASTAQGNQMAGCIAYSAGTPAQKYGYEDLANYASTGARNTCVACQSVGHGTAAFSTVGFLGSGLAYSPHPIRPASGTTVVDVSQTSLVVFLAYVAPTTVTNFTNGTTGQTIRCVGHVNVTIQNNANIQTNTGGDQTLATGKVYAFTSYNGTWYEAA